MKSNPIPCIKMDNGAIKSMIIIYDCGQLNHAFSWHLQNIWSQARAMGKKPKPATKTRIRSDRLDATDVLFREFYRRL